MASPSAISILSIILIIEAFVISTSYADPAPDPKPAPAVKIVSPVVPSSAVKIAAVSQVAEKKIDKDPLDAQESAQYGSRNPTQSQSGYGSQSAGSYDSSSNGQSNSYGNENNGNGYHAPSTPQQSGYNSAAPVPRPAAPAVNAYRPQGNGYGQQQSSPATQGYGQQNGASYGNQGNGQTYGQDAGSEAGYGSSDGDSYGNAGYGGDSSESVGDSSEDGGDNGYGSSGLGDTSAENGYSGLGGDEGLENSGADDGYDNGGGSSYGNGDSGYGGQAEYGNSQPAPPQHPQPAAAHHQNSNNNNYQSRPSTHPISASGPQVGNTYSAGNNNHGSINNRPLAGGYNAVKSQQSTNSGYNNVPANNSPGAPVSGYGAPVLAPAAPPYNHPPSAPSSSAYSQPSSAGYSSASHPSPPSSSSYSPPPPPAQQSYGQQSGYSNSGHGSSGQSSYPSSDSYGGSQGGYQQQPPQGLKSPAHGSNSYPPAHGSKSYPPPPAQSYNSPSGNNGYNSAPPAEPAYPQSPAQGTKSVYGSQLSPLPQSQPPAYPSSAPAYPSSAPAYSSSAPAYPSSAPSSAPAYPSSAPSAGPSYDTKSPPPQPAAPAQGYPDGGSSPSYDGQEAGTGTKTGLPMSYGGFTPLGRRPLNGGKPLVLEIVQKPPQDNNNYQVTVSDKPASKVPPSAPRPRPSYSSSSSHETQSAGYEAPQNSGSKLYSGPSSDPSYQGQSGLSQYTAGADGVYEGAPLVPGPDFDGSKYELAENPYLDSAYSGYAASLTEDINPALLSGQPGYGSSSAAAAGLAATSGYGRPPRKGLKIPSALGYPSAAYSSAAGYEPLAGLSSNQPQTPTYPRPIEVQYRTRTKGKNYLKAGYNLDYSGGIPYLADFTQKPYSTKFKSPSSASVSSLYGGYEAIDLAVPMKLHRKPRLPLPIVPPSILHHGRVPKMSPLSGHGLPVGMAEYGLSGGGLAAMASSPWSVPSIGLPKGFGSPAHKVSTGLYEAAASAHSAHALESRPYGSSMSVDRPYGSSMSIEEAKSLLKAAGYSVDPAKPGSSLGSSLGSSSGGSEETTPSTEEIVKSVNDAVAGSGSEGYKASSSRLVPTVIKTRFTSLYKALSKNRPFFG